MKKKEMRKSHTNLSYNDSYLQIIYKKDNKIKKKSVFTRKV